VSGVTGSVTVASGTDHSCAATADGVVTCWGADRYGQSSGVADVALSVGPSVVPGVTGTQLALGERHSCVLSDAGGLTCWGDLTPPEMMPLALVDSESSSACAVSVDGFLICFDSTSHRILPFENVTDVAVGHTHGCAIMNGEAWCWGANAAGQLGAGAGAERQSGVAVELGPGVTAIDAGGNASCAVVQGALHCWGEGFGATPVNLELDRDITDVEMGASFVCATTSDGSVLCFGDDRYGQLGL